MIQISKTATNDDLLAALDQPHPISIERGGEWTIDRVIRCKCKDITTNGEGDRPKLSCRGLQWTGNGEPGEEINIESINITSLGEYDYGIRVTQMGAKVNIMRCSVYGFRQNIMVQDANDLGITNCEILHAGIHHKPGKPVKAGVYITGVTDAIYILNNTIYKCGTADIFAHGIYIQSNNTESVFVTYNRIIDSGSHAAQLRTGGNFHNNYCSGNSIGVLVAGKSSYVVNNVFADADDIDDKTPRGSAIHVQSKGTWISGNLAINKVSKNNAHPCEVKKGGVITTCTNNRMINWPTDKQLDGWEEL